MTSQLGAAMVVWAASALGRELALHLSESKFSKLILVDEACNLLSVVAQECRERGRLEADVLSLTCDFGNPQAIKDLMAQAAEEVGPIECVANSPDARRARGKAGKCFLVVCLLLVWLWMREQISHALGQSGDKASGRTSIVNITTVHGFASEPGLPSYAVASHGIVGMTRTTAMDYVTSGIRINCVCHYPVTPSASSTSDESWERHGPAPLGRHITANEVARAAAFLLGPQSSAITGIVLPVDGGWSLYHH
ncbi:hypothetical protein FDECE_14815 [Fusarium decemcellulare]|nr:hypothetical protein FDECE_14815 [Fusarium decemcellulare]